MPTAGGRGRSKLVPAAHRRSIARRMARLRRRGDDESGQALVELALVLPILLLLVFAIIDFAHAYQQYNETTHLANIGARYATVGTNPGTGTLCDYIATGPEAQAAGMSNGSTSAIGVSVSAPSAVGQPLTVTVTTNYHWLPYIGGVTSTATSSISSTATMRLENGTGSGLTCSRSTPA